MWQPCTKSIHQRFSQALLLAFLDPHTTDAILTSYHPASLKDCFGTLTGHCRGISQTVGLQFVSQRLRPEIETLPDQTQRLSQALPGSRPQPTEWRTYFETPSKCQKPEDWMAGTSNNFSADNWRFPSIDQSPAFTLAYCMGCNIILSTANT